MAVFPSVGAALDAAVSIQQETHRRNRAQPDTPMRIRIGVATGDCVLEDEDYFGEPVVQAARLCNLAEGGAVLVGEIVRLAAPRGHHSFDLIGPVELKGIPDPVEVAQLHWAPSKEPVGEAPPLPDRLALVHEVSHVGRAQETETLSTCFKTAETGVRHVVLLSGEAGLGKTRLATELARSVHDDGALVLYGRCDEQLRLAYAPWAQALAHWARHADGSSAPAGGAELAQLLPDALEATAVRNDPAHTDQHALYSALTALLAELSEDRPVLLVLDDLHWADRDSLLLLRHVAGNLLNARVMVLGTYRDTDLHDGHPLEDLLAALRRETGVTRIHLAGLTSDEIGALVASTGSAAVASDEVRALLAEETGGNPFFLGELLHHLAATGEDIASVLGSRGPLEDGAPLSLPPSLKEVVIARVNGLGDMAARALTAAAVIGHEFDVDLLATVADLDQRDLLDVIDAGVGSGLLQEVDRSGDRLAFTHALIRRALTENLSRRRRTTLHREVLTAMEGPDRPHPSSAELAVHVHGANLPDGAVRLRQLAVEAGDDARGRRAPEEAIVWYRRSLEGVEPEGEDWSEMMVRLGDAERQAGHPEHREHLLHAAHAAERLGRSDLLVAAALANHRGFQSGAGVVDDERIQVLRRALSAVGDEELSHRARLTAMLATELSGDDPARVGLALEAIEVARRSGDTDALLEASSLALTVLVAPEHFDTAAALSNEAMDLTTGVERPARRMQVLYGEQAIQMIRGSIDDAIRCLDEYTALVEQSGQPFRHWTVALRSAVLSTVLGDYEQAQRHIDATLELGMATGQPDALVTYGGLTMGVAIHKGTTAELIGLIQDAAEQNPGLPILRAGAAAFLVAADRLDEAASAVATLGDLERSLPRDPFWLASLMLLAEATNAIGDRSGAAVLHRMLEPYASLIAVHPAGCFGATSLALGELGTTLGRADARHHLEDSLRRHERLRSPYLAARSHLALGWHEASHLEHATRLAERHGFTGIERAIRRSA